MCKSDISLVPDLCEQGKVRRKSFVEKMAKETCFTGKVISGFWFLSCFPFLSFYPSFFLPFFFFFFLSFFLSFFPSLSIGLQLKLWPHLGEKTFRFFKSFISCYSMVSSLIKWISNWSISTHQTKQGSFNWVKLDWIHYKPDSISIC